MVIIKLVHAKNIGFENYLVVVLGHLLPGVGNRSRQLARQNLVDFYKPCKYYKGSYFRCEH